MVDLQQHSEKLDFEKVWLMFQETKELLAKSSLETDRKMKETDQEIEKTKEMIDKASIEAEKERKETARIIKEIGKQIGGLGNKFGSFTEGLFMPSLIKILEKKFKCSAHFARYVFKDNGKSFEIDLIGISPDACYLIEIKSHLKEDAIKQLTRTISEFKMHSKESSERDIYGVITAASFSEVMVKKVTGAGLYFISTSNDLAKLMVPRGFKPKVW